MRALRQIYDVLPSMIEIPKHLRRRHVEVVFLELDERETPEATLNTDWPEGSLNERRVLGKGSH